MSNLTCCSQIYVDVVEVLQAANVPLPPALRRPPAPGKGVMGPPGNHPNARDLTAHLPPHEQNDAVTRIRCADVSPVLASCAGLARAALHSRRVHHGASARRREKNRLAARKCRQRKLHRIAGTQKQLSELHASNAELQGQLKSMQIAYAREVQQRKALEVSGAAGIPLGSRTATCCAQTWPSLRSCARSQSLLLHGLESAPEHFAELAAVLPPHVPSTPSGAVAALGMGHLDAKALVHAIVARRSAPPTARSRAAAAAAPNGSRAQPHWQQRQPPAPPPQLAPPAPLALHHHHAAAAAGPSPAAGPDTPVPHAGTSPSPTSSADQAAPALHGANRTALHAHTPAAAASAPTLDLHHLGGAEPYPPAHALLAAAGHLHEPPTLAVLAPAGLSRLASLPVLAAANLLVDASRLPPAPPPYGHGRVAAMDPAAAAGAPPLAAGAPQVQRSSSGLCLAWASSWLTTSHPPGAPPQPATGAAAPPPPLPPAHAWLQLQAPALRPGAAQHAADAAPAQQQQQQQQQQAGAAAEGRSSVGLAAPPGAAGGLLNLARMESVEALLLLLQNAGGAASGAQGGNGAPVPVEPGGAAALARQASGGLAAPGAAGLASASSWALMELALAGAGGGGGSGALDAMAGGEAGVGPGAQA